MLCVHIGCWCVHTLTRDTDAWARNCSWKHCTSNFTARCKKNTPSVALNCSWNNYRLCPGQCRSFDAVKGWNNGARWKGQEQRTNYPNDLPPRGDEFILAFARLRQTWECTEFTKKDHWSIVLQIILKEITRDIDSNNIIH